MMQFNICCNCGAKDGRAGMLINEMCLNCYDTKKRNEIVIHAELVRTEEELDKQFELIRR